MLEKLSKEQDKLMYKHRAEFIDFIMNNGKHQPKDLELSKELRDDIDWVYKKAGLKTPSIILTAKSYYEEKLMINAVFHMFGEKRMSNQMWNQVSNQVWNQVRDQVWNQVENQMWNQVWNQVSNQVYNQVKNQKLQWVEQSLGLPWNSGWFSFYTYFDKIGIVSNPDFTNYFGLVKNHGLWSIQFLEDWCIVTQLPKIIRRDEENRLHSIEAPSIEWRNGQKDYYIHGVYFEPELWEQVVSGLMPAMDVLKIENMEQKQAALSIISLSKILKEMDASLISVYMRKKPPSLSKKCVPDHNKLKFKPIELYKISGDKFSIDEDVKIVHYFCPSTGREYFDFVPEHIELAEEAMSWKFGFKNIKDYIENLVIET